MYEFPRGRALSVFSSKIAAMVAEIEKHPNEKHFVYSAFHERRGYGGHGAQAVVRALKQFAGFRDYGFNATTDGPVVATLGSVEEVKDTIRAFNGPNNDTGSVIRVLVASHRYNEGIDLASVRHVHVLEPLLSSSADVQLKGRAVRMYSHTRLPYPDHWTVTMHRYFCEPPDVATRIISVEAKLESVNKYVEDAEMEMEELKGVKHIGVRAARRALVEDAYTEAKSLQKVVGAELKALQDIARCPHVDGLVKEAVQEADRSITDLMTTLKRLAQTGQGTD
jgi:hypothetical protein